MNSVHKVKLTKGVLKHALADLGLKQGNLVFVHSSLSALGYIEGGADAVIDAFMESIGPSGTLLMANHPAPFTIIDNGLRRLGRKGKMPFNPLTTPSGAGRIADTFWRRRGVLRSLHPTHAVAGIGPLAEDILAKHLPLSRPFGREGPFWKIVEYNGYFLFFGVELTCTTFFHALEEWHNLPYLQTGLVLVEQSGREETARIEGLPSGHRDFYTLPNKILARLQEMNASIRTVRIGLGQIKMIAARELYEKGSEILRNEPDIFLCDNPDCEFCSEWRAKMRYWSFEEHE